MKPVVILDKSAIQCLNSDEVMFLTKHYRVVVPPILITEVLADLHHKKKDRADAEKIVAILASKLGCYGTTVCANHEDLLIGSLLGHKIPMNGQIPRIGGRRFPLKRGGYGILYDELPEEIALRNWSEGNFSKEEENAAKNHRNYIEKINLNETIEKNSKKLPKAMPKNDIELKEMVAKAFSFPELENEMLLNQIEALRVDPTCKMQIFNRWQALGMPSFSEFSPYAAYYNKAEMSFYLSLSSGLITTRPTNYIDRVYLFYLPITMAFVSGDKCQKFLASILIREDQTLVDSMTLKEDLKNIKFFWDGLSEIEKTVYAREIGSRPPFFRGSISNEIWLKNMGPWKRDSGNLAVKIEQSILDEITPKILQKMNLENPYK